MSEYNPLEPVANRVARTFGIAAKIAYVPPAGDDLLTAWTAVWRGRPVEALTGETDDADVVLVDAAAGGNPAGALDRVLAGGALVIRGGTSDTTIPLSECVGREVEVTVVQVARERADGSVG